MPDPIVVVGAGLAGLQCARALTEQGLPVRVYEAVGHVGGRVTTAEVDGFLLDRGFQTMLTSYPNAQASLDYNALDLHPFRHGALIHHGGTRHRLLDPWHSPLEALGGLFAPVATIRDAVRIAKLRFDCLGGTTTTGPQTTLELLRDYHMSNRVIERFFRPFFGGVFLERELSTGADFFRFVFGMFAQGQAVIPARGMRAIPEQLASHLPDGCLNLNTPVTEVGEDYVVLQGARRIPASSVVVAVDPDTASDWAQQPRGGWNGATTLYYAAERSPLNEGILLLNGDGEGPVNHVCVPSDVCQNYAPPGAALISATVLGDPPTDDATIDRRVRQHMTDWFGPRVSDWKLLQIDRVRHALPTGTPRPHPGQQIHCGDYLTNPSIDGALQSGTAAAAEVAGRLTGAVQ